MLPWRDESSSSSVDTSLMSRQLAEVQTDVRCVDLPGDATAASTDTARGTRKLRRSRRRGEALQALSACDMGGTSH